MKDWALLDERGLVVHRVRVEDGVEPPAAVGVDGRGVEWVDVTGVDPLPGYLWFQQEDNSWVSGRPELLLDRPTIPGDGTTFALVTYRHVGPTAPGSVTFVVNGTEVTETLTGGSATLEVVSSSPGDQIVVTVPGLDPLPIFVEA